jgi:uncharacterized protein YybS (DUF2232 family)
MEETRGAEFHNQLSTITNVVLRVYLGLLIVGTGFVVWCNVIISRPIFRLAKLQYPDFGPLDQWHAPERMVWALIGAGFALFLSVGFVQFLAVNVLIVVMTVYLYNGLSILVFFLKKYRIPTWFRAGIYFLIVFQQILLVALALAGLFDQWVDFRRTRTRKVTS